MTSDELAELSWVRQAAANGFARQVRLAARVGLTEMAGAVAVSRPALSRWERGIRVPSPNTGLRYARALRALMKPR